MQEASFHLQGRPQEFCCWPAAPRGWGQFDTLRTPSAAGARLGHHRQSLAGFYRPQAFEAIATLKLENPGCHFRTSWSRLQGPKLCRSTIRDQGRSVPDADREVDLQSRPTTWNMTLGHTAPSWPSSDVLRLGSQSGSNFLACGLHASCSTKLFMLA